MQRSILLLVVGIMMATLTQSQKAFVDDDEFDTGAQAALNRRPVGDELHGGLEMDIVPSKQQKTKLRERFLGGDFTDGQWRDRADLTLWYDQSDKLVKVEIENH